MKAQWRAEQTTPDTGWADDDELYGAEEPSAGYPPDNLVTLRFLRASVRRHSWLWLIVAAIGLAAGTAFPHVLPPADESSVKLLLTHRDGENPEAAMATDASLVTTRTIAQRTITQLGLTETPDDLLKRYEAAPLTDRVLEIKTKAKSSAEATALADTLAKTYLSFRAEQLRAQEVPLRAGVTNAKAAVAAAEAAYRAAGGDPDDPDARPSTLLNRLNRARENLRFIEQQLLAQAVSSTQMNSSRLLDVAAPIPRSAKYTQAVASASGLLAGLFLGIGFVVGRAMISDRLWRRQDISQALGARVRLSLGWPRRRWLGLRSRAAERQLLVKHLQSAVPANEQPVSALTVVSVDNVSECADAVAQLAVACVEEGRHVVVADLTSSRRLATGLGVKKPGTWRIRPEGAAHDLTVYIPAGTGPVEGCHLPTGEVDLELAGAWSTADVVLTLATVSPALGADHLRSWSAAAAVVVSTGRSTATRLSTIGELIKLAGVRVVSAVQLRADRNDETLGDIEYEHQTGSTIGVVPR